MPSTVVKRPPKVPGWSTRSISGMERPADSLSELQGFERESPEALGQPYLEKVTAEVFDGLHFDSDPLALRGNGRSGLDFIISIAARVAIG